MENLSNGDHKVEEYVQRILNGEQKESIFNGLPPSFKDAIERKLRSVSGNEVEFSEEPLEGLEDLPIVERIKLRGWAASYELAKIAKRENRDLSKFSREEYADFAIEQNLAIDDDQLRADPWQRMEVSAVDIIAKKKEMRLKFNPYLDKVFHTFAYKMKEKAGSLDRVISPGVWVRQGTKDSDSWLYFGINGSTNNTESETYKSYLHFADLNKCTPELFLDFMKHLQEKGYNGDVKIFQDLAIQGVTLNDQIVMHGFSEKDAILALDIATGFFGSNIDHKSVGKDEVVNGKSKSYSQILSDKILTTILENN